MSGVCSADFELISVFVGEGMGVCAAPGLIFGLRFLLPLMPALMPSLTAILQNRAAATIKAPNLQPEDADWS